MSDLESKLAKGSVIADRYEVQFPSGPCGISESFRVKDRDGSSRRLELIDLASLPGSYYDDNDKLRHLEILRTIEHPNIPDLLDEGETVIDSKRYAFFVFPWISGESLADLLARNGTLSPYKVLPIALELLETLKFLHNRDVPLIHNGISTRSVILDYSADRDKPVLIGFDQARDIHASRDSISLKGLFLFHAAPELLHGIFVPQSDLFSVGALIYNLIFGSPPWFSEAVMTAPANKVKTALEKARSRPLNFDFIDENTLDLHFRMVLEKALSIDVQSRFETANEFARALKRELVFEGSTAQISFERNFENKEKAPGTGFDGLAGMAELKSILHNEVIRPIVERERFEKFGIPLLNGVLLYGPPGCGKTFVAERLVEEIGFSFIMVNPSDLASPYVHGGQEKIGQLFKDAEEKAPCLVFIDEFDALVPSRESDVSHHYAAEVNEILAQMSSCGKRGIFIIGATNRPEKIDEAVLRSGRFDKLIYLPQPDLEQRESIFRQHLARCPVDLGVDYTRLADLTKNYVSSDIANLVVEAARKAEKADTRVTMEMLEQAIKENKPSVTLKQLKKYEKMNQQWQDERKGIDVDGQKSIGFILPDED
ncbi:MAG: AAA family ATPase [Chloracidobacterium sp.]|nr:AAA family ATPase [Chloracidobacterium sp.]